MYIWQENESGYSLLIDGKSTCLLCYSEAFGRFVVRYQQLGAGSTIKLKAASVEEAKAEALQLYERHLVEMYTSNKALNRRIEPLLAHLRPDNTHHIIKDMDTLKQRDQLLREAFLQLADVPMNPETEVMEASFMHFPPGTSREEIWKWFDERYSKGIVDLLYLEGIDHHPELQKLFHRRACCFECDSETCAYNPEGICMYPILYGRVPEYVDDVGCDGFVYKET